MSLSIVELNGFVKGGDGVFARDGSAEVFDYSDGESTEKRLHEVLSEASDLSCDSPELQSHIVDWPTEYHLSETRANLLRPLDLSGVSRVLELGCGCGSISRYLGEQGIQVDSIEGSPIRAGLAALRCRDLPNVSISTGNFNDIAVPENHYDLVLFVGVTEYAGRFSDKETDQEALNDLLGLGKRAATADGVVFVAIENRAGLKYLQGACEDHYAVPHVGLEDYPESTGIRTYTRKEWHYEVEKVGFKNIRFAFPFPDYKVPTMVINDHVDKGDSRVIEAFNKVESRDYSRPFSLREQEAWLWRGILEAGTLNEHSNSFMIFMSDDEFAINKLAAFDIVEYKQPKLNYALPNYELPITAGAHSSGHDNASKSEREIERLKTDLQQLQLHSNELEHTIETMTHSLGWRVFGVIRRVFGKNSIR